MISMSKLKNTIHYWGRRGRGQQREQIHCQAFRFQQAAGAADHLEINLECSTLETHCSVLGCTYMSS